jgi:osmoprotectant transport system permease protein
MNNPLLAMPLAAVGQVEEGFFHERTGETLPCQAHPSHLFCWHWASENINRYGTPTLQQFELVIISVVVGFVIAFAFALLAHRYHLLQWPLLAGTGILFAIPSLAFFLLLLPITGRGSLTAIIALTSYTLLILFRNVVAGLDAVPDGARDAGRGMGLTERQLLWQVEVPLATPAIIAGLRVAATTTVGLAALAFFAGAGGLGEQLASDKAFKSNVVFASLLCVVMAVALDGLLVLAQRVLSPWSRRAA